MSALPLLPVTTVGSWPRPERLLHAQKLKRAGRLPTEEFDRLADEAVRDLVRMQVDAGVDLLTDGEQRRDNFYSFVAEKLEGVRIMTLAEMLDVVEDKVSFERILQTLDVPAYAISNPTCVGRIRRRAPLAVDEAVFLKEQTDKPVKVPLPGPYLLTRAMFVPEVSRQYYPSKEALAADVVALLRDEIEALVRTGVEFIQLDEPVLTELVFTQGQTRTFMCAALALRRDPAEELALATSLINQVVEGISGARIGLHICRGNWSQDESTLLRGSYHPLAPYLDRLAVDQLVLEYATERAGDLLEFPDKELGLGVVNPRIERVESPEEIRRSIREALKLYAPERLFLNPDCGFGTFSSRPVATGEIAFRKMRNIVDAVAPLRAELAAVPIARPS